MYDPRSKTGPTSDSGAVLKNIVDGKTISVAEVSISGPVVDQLHKQQVCI